MTPVDRRPVDPRRARQAVDQLRAVQGRKALRRRRRGRPATDRTAADAHPVAGNADDGARFRGRPERQAAAGLRLHRPARVSAHPRDREVGKRVLVLHPTRIEIDRVDMPEVLWCGGVFQARDERGVATFDHAVRGGEDQITCGRVQHPAGAGVQRAAAQEHRTHPRIGRYRLCGRRRFGCDGRGLLHWRVVRACRGQRDEQSGCQDGPAGRGEAHDHRSCPNAGRAPDDSLPAGLANIPPGWCRCCG